MGVSNNLAGLTNMFKIVNKQDYLRDIFAGRDTQRTRFCIYFAGSGGFKSNTLYRLAYAMTWRTLLQHIMYILRMLRIT